MQRYDFYVLQHNFSAKIFAILTKIIILMFYSMFLR